jgi:hypothetical protein
VVASRHGEFGAALGEAKSQVASAQAPASPGQIARIIANRFPPITRDVLLTGKNDEGSEHDGSVGMKLLVNRPSPYGRKVLVVLHEKGLSNRVEVIPADPRQDPPELIGANPVAKVPTLMLNDGTQLTEGTTISEYLNLATAAPILVGDDRWEVMRRVGLAQGLIDAAFATVMEQRRPPVRLWPDWIARQRRAIDRVLGSSPNLLPTGVSISATSARRALSRIWIIARSASAGAASNARARGMAGLGQPAALDASYDPVTASGLDCAQRTFSKSAYPCRNHAA